MGKCWLLLVPCLLIILTVITFNQSQGRCTLQKKKIGQTAGKRILIYTSAIGTGYDLDRIKGNRQRYTRTEPGTYFIINSNTTFVSKPQAAWLKIEAFLTYFNDYDYIWLLDADAYLMNPMCSIQYLVGKHRNMDIIGASDLNAVMNTGSFLIRTSEWSRGFVHKMLAERNNTSIYNMDIWWENAVLIWLLDNMQKEELVNHVALIPQREINSYPLGYKNGDFILHGAGLGYSTINRIMYWVGWKEMQ